MNTTKVRRKPIVETAVQYNPAEIQRFTQYLSENKIQYQRVAMRHELQILTSEGVKVIEGGQWLVYGGAGVFVRGQGELKRDYDIS